MIDGHWIKRKTIYSWKYVLLQVYCRKCGALRTVNQKEVGEGYLLRLKSPEIRELWKKSSRFTREVIARIHQEENCELLQVQKILSE